LVIVTAPETQRLAGDQKYSSGIAGHHHTPPYQFSNRDSSRTTRPAMADWTQSAMLPNTT
jgi:hypothetical protein